MSVLSYSGYLHKRGHFMRTWKRRFFTLEGNKLSYCTEKDGELKGEFIITKTTTLNESPMRPFCFCLRDDREGSELFMFATDEHEMFGWMEVLNEGIVMQKAQAQRMEGEQLARVYDVSSQSDSVLEIRVLGARNLRPKNAPASPNAYVIVKVGMNMPRTSVVAQDSNPSWNEKFTFHFDRTIRLARLEVWHSDDGGSTDRFLGMVLVPLFSLSSSRSISGWLGLGKRLHGSNVSGEIQFEILTKLEKESFPLDIYRHVFQLPEMAFLSPCLPNYLPITKKSKFFQFPGEVLDDIALQVAFKTTFKSEPLFFLGIVILTNYRLIFVSCDRLDGISGKLDNLDVHSLEFSLYVMLGSIVSVAISEEKDEGTGMSMDTVQIKTFDNKVFSLMFRDTGFDSAVSQKNTATPAASSSSSSMPASTSRQSSLDFGNIRFSSISSFATSAVMPMSAPVPMRSDSVSAPSFRSASTKAVRLTVDTQIFNCLNCLFKNFWTEGLRLYTTFEASWSLDEEHGITNDFVHYLSAGDSIDGTPSRRLFRLLEFRSMNRHLEITQSKLYFENLKPSFRSSSSSNLDQRSDFDHTIGDEIIQGWNLYDMDTEFGRIGLPDQYWKFHLNEGSGQICNSYPGAIVVPADLDTAVLMSASTFRSVNRVPALVWRHPKNFASLTRSSQPLVSIMHKRSSDDELLVELICHAGFKANFETQEGRIGYTATSTTRFKSEQLDLLSENLEKESADYDSGSDYSDSEEKTGSAPKSKSSASIQPPEYELKPLLIFDCRPQVDAFASLEEGKGFEDPKRYKNSRIQFLGMLRPSALRSSLEAVEQICACKSSYSDDRFLMEIENTGWLQSMACIIDGAAQIVNCIDRKHMSVLVHCSDGWDRTAQLCSLAKLMLDPHYRTLRGFMALIEQEWFSFGHKFADRLGFSQFGWSSEERSPVFHVFIESVYHLTAQMSHIFEFNETFLVFVLRAFNTGLFGNVYVNREADIPDVSSCTVSLWSAVMSCEIVFKNPNYFMSDRIWTPVASQKRVSLWGTWFCNWHDYLWRHISSRYYDSSLIATTGAHERLIEAIKWVPDMSFKKNCSDPSCKLPFTTFRRRHRCRNCDKRFCEKCSDANRIVSFVSPTVPVRCCKECVKLIDAATLAQALAESKLRATSTAGNTGLGTLQEEDEEGCEDSFMAISEPETSSFM